VKRQSDFFYFIFAGANFLFLFSEIVRAFFYFYFLKTIPNTFSF